MAYVAGNPTYVMADATTLAVAIIDESANIALTERMTRAIRSQDASALLQTVNEALDASQVKFIARALRQTGGDWLKAGRASAEDYNATVLRMVQAEAPRARG